MYELAVLIKWLSAIVAMVALSITIFHCVKLSTHVKNGDGYNFQAIEVNSEIRTYFGIVLSFSLLLYFIFDLVIVIIRNIH